MAWIRRKKGEVMKRFFKLSAVVAVTVIVQMGGTAEALFIQYRPPVPTIDRILDTETITLAAVTASQDVFMQRNATGFTTINSSLAVSGNLFATGLIQGELEIQNGGAVDISQGTLVVTGGVVAHNGSEVMIGGFRAPAPPPPPPGGIDPGKWAGIDPGLHQIYANIDGKLTDVTGAARAIAYLNTMILASGSASPDFGGHRMLGGFRAPAPPPAPPGGMDGGFLNATGITLDDGSALNFGFSSTFGGMGYSMLLAGLGGGHLAVGNDVATNLAANMIITNSDPAIWELSSVEYGELVTRYREYGNAPVPEPSTVILFGAGIAGLLGFRIRQRKQTSNK